MIGWLVLPYLVAIAQSRPQDDKTEYITSICPAGKVQYLIPNENDCTKFFVCGFGRVVQNGNCNDGLEFSVELQKCTEPAIAKCSINFGSKPKTYSLLETPETEKQQKKEIVRLPNGCPKNIHIAELLPHEAQCDLFYQCDMGKKVLRNCAEGTHFSYELQICDDKSRVNCVTKGGGDSNHDSNHVGKGDNDIGQESVIEHSNNIGETFDRFPNGCPVNEKIRQLLPHRNYCHKFYYCDHGQLVIRECPEKTHFNPILQACDHPDNVGCVDIPPGDTGEIEDGKNPNGTSTGDDHDFDKLPNGCPVDDQIQHQVPHEISCHKFYDCVHGNRVLRECASGTHFNPTLQRCDYPVNVGCVDKDPGDSGETEDGNRNPNGTSTEESHDFDKLPNGCPVNVHINHHIPHEISCNKFYECVHGELVQNQCPNGTYFNPNLQICDHPMNVSCVDKDPGDSGEIENGNTSPNGSSAEASQNSDKLPNGCPVNETIHISLPHESDCRQFYHCVHGEPVQRECPLGTHFNPILQVCDDPEKAGCINKTSEEAGNDTGCAIGPNAGCNCDNDETVDNRCKENCHVPHWAHKNDCDKFWQCVGNERKLGICSEGLHFNVRTQTCDFIFNAGCKRDKIQSTAQSDGLKLFLPWNKFLNR